MIKAVFFDVDGTLVSHKSKSVPESAKKALAKLREQGILVFLATGRHVHELKKMPIDDMVFDGYVLLNGQLCLDANKNIIFSHSFSEEDVKGLLEIFHGDEYAIVLVNKDCHYMNFVDELTLIGLESVSTPVPMIRAYEGEELYQATVFILPENDEEFEKRLPPGCKLARWGSHGADIIARDGGKAVGMRFFSEFLGITSEEMMAFGDAQNDMDMLEYAGIGIAMGNAEDCLKEIANDVTTDVDADGVLNALVKYGILKKDK
ncbi:MAG: Cof-type HAD-IIB family hydrolase [Lachnospiraceae bacterium]|nr:Cof-type HAD-IIB family hydrolase [Lachnospiraceae bacterium]